MTRLLVFAAPVIPDWIGSLVEARQRVDCNALPSIREILNQVQDDVVAGWL